MEITDSQSLNEKIADITKSIIGIIILIFGINTIFEQFADSENDLDNLRTLMKITLAISIAGEYRLLKRISSLEEEVRKLKVSKMAQENAK